MEKLSVSKERVIEAANKCSTAKNILTVLFPEVFEEAEGLKKGTWVIVSNGCGNYIGRFDKKRLFGGVDTTSYCCLDEAFGSQVYDMGVGSFSKIERLATKEEIEKHLIALAEKKGFVKGARFYGCEGVKKSTPIKIGENHNIVFNSFFKNEGLYCDDSWIYLNGQWGTVIQEPVIVEITMDEIAKLKGCDVSQLKIKK